MNFFYKICLIFILVFTSILSPSLPCEAQAEEWLANKLAGHILLQVESAGEAWYVNPVDKKRYYLGKPEDAFTVMRNLGVGISNSNLAKIDIGLVSELFVYSDGKSKRPKLLLEKDSDQDGLSNMLENTICTDPDKKDSDGDTYDDYTELTSKENYDPCRANGAKVDSIDLEFSKNNAGKIFLQVENQGQAWYLNPQDNKRYYLGRPEDAFRVMRTLGLGISDADIAKIQTTENAEESLKNIGEKTVSSSAETSSSTEATADKIVDKEDLENQNNIEDSQEAEPQVSEVQPLVGVASSSYINKLSEFYAAQNVLIQKLEKDNQAGVINGGYMCAGKAYKCEEGLNFYCIDDKAECRAIPKQGLNIDIKTLEKKIFNIINTKRKEKSLPEFKSNIVLTNMAREHSANMIRKQFFKCEAEHCDLMYRFNQNLDTQTAFIENIAAVFVYQSTYGDGIVAEYKDMDTLADSIVETWLSSASRDILFTEKYDYQGIGVSIDSDGKIYVTQDVSSFLSVSETEEVKKIILDLFQKENLDEVQEVALNDRIAKIYNWITSNISYDAKNYLEDTVPQESFSLLGAWRAKKAVCQGYAELFRFMLDLVGVESELVSGTADNSKKYEAHAWNKVRIGDEDFYFDATWDSGYLNKEEKSFVRRAQTNYYKLPYKCIKLNHARNREEELSADEQQNYIFNNLDFFQKNCPGLM